MIVNISRSKLLINSTRQSPRRTAKSLPRCNHCGGLLKPSGDAMACIMCSREMNHICSLCTHVKPNDLQDKNKKTA